MSEKKYTGFEQYLEKHEFTPDFIHDYKYWCWKIFKRWTLFIDFDTFYSRCWEALLEKINEFDSKIATIQTFCISRINNEAWRFYMKNKTARVEIDTENPVIQNTLTHNSNDIDNYEMFSDFERYANSLGVQVNVKELYADYTECKESAPMIAFAAWRAMNKDIGGRNDILKTKRRTPDKSRNQEQYGYGQSAECISDNW